MALIFVVILYHRSTGLCRQNMTLALIAFTTIIIVAFAECKVRKKIRMIFMNLLFFSLPAWRHRVLTELRVQSNIRRLSPISQCCRTAHFSLVNSTFLNTALYLNFLRITRENLRTQHTRSLYLDCTELSKE